MPKDRRGVAAGTTTMLQNTGSALAAASLLGALVSLLRPSHRPERAA
jgi:hypothetical protein